MFGLMKVAVVVAVIAVAGGLITHWVKGEAISEFHHAIDTSLPGDLEGHPWAPVTHDGPGRSARVRFDGSRVTDVRCHTVLGTYSVTITHHFSFQAHRGPLRAGCPGRQLRSALSHASRVDVSNRGSTQQLTFTDDKDHVVARLRGRAA